MGWEPNDPMNTAPNCPLPDRLARVHPFDLRVIRQQVAAETMVACQRHYRQLWLSAMENWRRNIRRVGPSADDGGARITLSPLCLLDGAARNLVWHRHRSSA